MDISHEEILSYLDKKIFRIISSAADEMELECYLIGGYVRDFFSLPPIERYRYCGSGKRN